MAIASLACSRDRKLFLEGSGGGPPAQNLAGPPVVEAVSDGLEFEGRPARQVSTLGEVPVQQTVAILISNPCWKQDDPQRR